MHAGRKKLSCDLTGEDRRNELIQARRNYKKFAMMNVYLIKRVYQGWMS